MKTETECLISETRFSYLTFGRVLICIFEGFPKFGQIGLQAYFAYCEHHPVGTAQVDVLKYYNNIVFEIINKLNMTFL